MRFLVAGLLMAGTTAAIACGGGDATTRAPEANLTLAELPVKLPDPSAVPAGIHVLVVRDGSHCEDLTNLYPGKLAGVFEAHLTFNKLAKEWIAQ